MILNKESSRRAFLVGSAAITGGVAFGGAAFGGNRLKERLGPKACNLTPWITLDKSGITLITPHTDLGQGAAHMQALLIAEELDVDIEQISVSPGLPSDELYGNTALSAPGFPPTQGTGGSSSVRDSYEKLRQTGAVARETLKKAASLVTGVKAERLTTAKGKVILPNKSELSYILLAPLAAKLEPVNEVSLRPSSQWRLVGKPTQRLDIVEKATGTLPFGIDFELDGMVHATVKLNPRQGGELLSYDDSSIQNMPGVIGAVRITHGLAVIADNTWRAFKAADAINCEWGPSSYPPEMAQHWEAVADSFVEDRLNNEWQNEGDVTAAGTSLEAEYRAPYLAHAPLEPLSVTMLVTSDQVTVWVGTQVPTAAQRAIAAMTNLDVEQVTIHNQYVGGSFGHRLEFDFILRCTEVAMTMPGTPVKLTYSREEDIMHDYPRQLTAARMRGNTESGGLNTLDIQVASTSVLTSQLGRLGLPFPPGAPDEEIVAGIVHAPYSFQNFRLRGYAVPGLAPVSSWRSVGASSNGFFLEGFLDELIHQAGRDPLEERLRLANSDVSRRVLEAVGELSNWGSNLGPNRARGIAFVESFGTPVAEVIEISQTADGIKIDKVYVTVDVGPVVDPINLEAQITGGVVWGLGHAIKCEITYSDGIPQQTNFNTFDGMRLFQCPEIEVRTVETRTDISGMGEPSVPPAAPALANAIYALTGQRIREMPFHKFIRFI